MVRIEQERGVNVLGSGGDYTAFVHNGIASIDNGCANGLNDPVYHYHSNYDSFHWMTTYGDPGFRVHKAVGQHLALLVYHLAMNNIIPFNVENFGAPMTRYLDTLTTLVQNTTATVDLFQLEAAIATFNDSAAALTSFMQTAWTNAEYKLINAKLRDFGRGFVSQGGLPTREFYKHVVFAPGLDTGYASFEWLGVTEAGEAKNASLAQLWVEKSARAVEATARILVP